MTRQQKRKMERNSKKKQTSEFNIISTVMVDTKSIIENKKQFTLTDEEKLKNHLKNNQRLMETKVLVNFFKEKQHNFGIINIIHEYTNDSDSKRLIYLAIKDLFKYTSERNLKTVLQDSVGVKLLSNLTVELEFNSTQSVKENIDHKVFESVVELLQFNKELAEGTPYLFGLAD
jgi:CRISPR/Cas system-associated endonuclease/helicase Cas3